jgi:Tol biopolymer transport system component
LQAKRWWLLVNLAFLLLTAILLAARETLRVVSLDGELLSSIRQVKGRDSLRTRMISAGRPGAGTIGERQIAASQYDVREVAFLPDHQVVFSLSREGRFRLYEINPVSEAIEEIGVPTCSAHYPAVSPDGEWIAFSCDHRGAWQIHVMNLRSAPPGRLIPRSLLRNGLRPWARIDGPSEIERVSISHSLA